MCMCIRNHMPPRSPDQRIPHAHVIPDRQIPIMVRRLDSHGMIESNPNQFTKIRGIHNLSNEGEMRRRETRNSLEGCLAPGPEHDCNVALQSLLHPKVEGHIQREDRREKCLDSRGTGGVIDRGNNRRGQVYARLWCVMVS